MCAFTRTRFGCSPVYLLKSMEIDTTSQTIVSPKPLKVHSVKLVTGYENSPIG